MLSSSTKPLSSSGLLPSNSSRPPPFGTSAAAGTAGSSSSSSTSPSSSSTSPGSPHRPRFPSLFQKQPQVRPTSSRPCAVRRAAVPHWNRLDRAEQLRRKDLCYRRILSNLRARMKECNPALARMADDDDADHDRLLAAKPIKNRSADGQEVQCFVNVFVVAGGGGPDLTLGLPAVAAPSKGLPAVDEDGPVDIVPVERLRYLPDKTRLVARELEQYLRASGIPSAAAFSAGGPGWARVEVWESVRGDRDRGQIMLKAVFNSRGLTRLQLKDVREKLKTFFSAGPGLVCGLDSLYFEDSSEKQQQPQQQLERTEPLWGQRFIKESILDQKFRIWPGSVAAGHPATKGAVCETVAELAGLPDPDCTLVDLYCGSGTLGLANWQGCGQVLGLDILESPAVQEARVNAADNGATNAEFLAGSVEDSLSRILCRSNHDRMVCVVDPPAKAGMTPRAVQALRRSLKQRPGLRTLIYVASSLHCENDEEGQNVILKNLADFCRPPSNSYKGDPLVPVKAVALDTAPYNPEFTVVFLCLRVPMADLVNNPRLDDLKRFKDRACGGTVCRDHRLTLPDPPPFPGPLPDLSWKPVVPEKATEGTSGTSGLADDQAAWLDQMTVTYGDHQFRREEWARYLRHLNSTGMPTTAVGAAHPGPDPPPFPGPPLDLSWKPVVLEKTTGLSCTSGLADDQVAWLDKMTETYGADQFWREEWTRYLRHLNSTGMSTTFAGAAHQRGPYGNAVGPGEAGQPAGDWTEYCRTMAQYWWSAAAASTDSSVQPENVQGMAGSGTSVEWPPPLPEGPPPPKTKKSSA